ncbi:MAG: hypothetical protein KJO07_21705 [Deltaproteobacteria bacterium]|jgi:hypothetical protein|nr:hypothetical protein [Deltaproteobacteria bacterium]
MRRILRACIALTGLAMCLGCPTVDLGETPVAPGSCRPSRVYFDTVIWPEYLAPSTEASCVGDSGCHRRSDGRSSLRLTTDPVDLGENYDVTTRFLNCGSAANSSLLTKPLSGQDAHGGGELFGSGDPAFDTFLDWFNAQ